MSMGKFFFIVIIIAFNISCNQKKEKSTSFSDIKKSSIDSVGLDQLIEKAKFDSSYYKVEIYCWCFGDVPLYKKKDGSTVMQGQLCETPFSINAEDLIKPNRLYYSVTDKPTINSLENLLFNRADSIKKINYSIDSRFLILFRKNAGVDTFNYYRVNNFFLNGDYQYKYSFNILDTVSKILKIKYIKCPS
jgi:hypothetical protein